MKLPLIQIQNILKQIEIRLKRRDMKNMKIHPILLHNLALLKFINGNFSNSSIIHDVIGQPERSIRVRWMTLKLNETPVENN